MSPRVLLWLPVLLLLNVANGWVLKRWLDDWFRNFFLNRWLDNRFHNHAGSLDRPIEIHDNRELLSMGHGTAVKKWCCGNICCSGKRFCCNGECILPSAYKDDGYYRGRPGWKADLKREFDNIPSRYQEIGCEDLEIAHVRSWENIKKFTTIAIDNGDWHDLEEHVKLLFRFDSEAVVWFSLSRRPKSTRWISHKVYLGEDLVEMNQQYRTRCLCLIEALKHRNDDEYKYLWANDLLLMMNSAPANLRWGCGSPNSSVGKYLDPMGNAERRMTKKEKTWLREYGSKTFKFYGQTCSPCDCKNAVWSTSATSNMREYYVCP